MITAFHEKKARKIRKNLSLRRPQKKDDRRTERHEHELREKKKITIRGKNDQMTSDSKGKKSNRALRGKKNSPDGGKIVKNSHSKKENITRSKKETAARSASIRKKKFRAQKSV